MWPKKIYAKWVPVGRRKKVRPNRIWKDDVKGSTHHDLEKGIGMAE
jgi:hypothetical protein